MEIPKKIQDAITNNSLVVFAGSGLSSNFNLPSWSKLVEDIILDINKEDYNVFLPVLKVGSMKPIEVLEKLKPAHNEIKRYIVKHFNISKGDFSLQEKIIDLSGQIITTNYDNAFELASKNTILPSVYTSKFTISELNKNSNPYIFKLHGSFSEPDNCIIFKEDYQNLYSENTAAKEKLKSIFAEKTILFLGFSFQDSDINLIFNNLDQAFGNNNKHFILTVEPDKFSNYKFIDPIKISDFKEIDSFLDLCLNFKRAKRELSSKDFVFVKKQEVAVPKIAFLYPNPLDIDLKDEFHKIIKYFESLDASLLVGALNIKTLLTIEDYDLVVIASKVFRTNLYIEDDNLKSNFLSAKEICETIPNDKIPIIFITNEKIESVKGQPTINISSFKHSIINKFLFKALKKRDLNFIEEEISVNLTELLNKTVATGQAKVTSIYDNNKELEIGQRCLTNVIGRIEEQSAIALKLLSIRKSSKLLNIKASGGTGKTTLIKKIGYELYNRGYYKEGVTFKSCENVKTFSDFEEILIDGFKLTNILDFKNYLIENYSFIKIDLLVILDNFETVVNSLNQQEFNKVIELLKFVTEHANIVVTSREKLSPKDDFEDVYSLTPMITDDALELFQKFYGEVKDPAEIRMLRTEILEDLLNTNPLAIKLVTKSRTSFKHISELKEQLVEHFFESINEDYSLVFKNNADLNIERTKSIYQSINYSYRTLNNKEKLAFELLNLFPDGISLSNFKKCFEEESSSNNISDKELRVLRDKSLVEDYNGTLQLQPLIRRFAEYQFTKRPEEIKRKYFTDAYSFNGYIIKIIELVEKKKSRTEALKVYSYYKNNLLKVLSYIPDVEIVEEGRVPEKKYLLNYISLLSPLIANEKQVSEFLNRLNSLENFFSDIAGANTLVKVMNYHKTFYHLEFDNSYKKLAELLPVPEMENRVFKNEDYIENKYKDMIANVHTMEGYTIGRIKSQINNNDTSVYLDSDFFYLGIDNNISRKKDGFYFFEYELMFKKLDISVLERYIKSLYLDEHLESMQCTYTLSKVKELDKGTIQKLVVTNPYTRGLKHLMYAFISKEDHEKINHFEQALANLSHIKYYYLECLYYYCLFLKDKNIVDYKIKLKEGLALSKKFYYQYLDFLFENIENESSPIYRFKYSYYPLESLEEYVKKHNENWEKIFKDYDVEF